MANTSKLAYCWHSAAYGKEVTYDTPLGTFSLNQVVVIRRSETVA
ncbi:MAG: hypothetical protein WAU01_02930 [Saprospiraceae bacterium]